MTSKNDGRRTKMQALNRLAWAMRNPHNDGFDSTMLLFAVATTVLALMVGGALIVVGFALFCWCVYAWLVLTSLKEYDEIGEAAAQEDLLQARARNDALDRQHLSQNQRRMAAMGAVGVAGAAAMDDDDWMRSRDEPTWTGPMANVDGTPFAPGMSVDVKGNTYGVTDQDHAFHSDSFSTDSLSTDSFGSDSWSSGSSSFRDD